MSNSQTTPILGSILVADDQDDVLMAARFLLEAESYQVETVNSPKAVIEALGLAQYDALIMDLNYTMDTTSGEEGLDLLEEVNARYPQLAVMVMTAWGTIDKAVDAMRRGANDFVQKPWQNERLLNWVKNQCELNVSKRKASILEAENQLLREEQYRRKIIGKSPEIEGVIQTIHGIATSPVSVLITGENGTGKSLFAKLVHDLSSCSDGPFVSVNMGAIPESLFESELFGHKKGAFTDAKTERMGRVELANEGTLFFDEIANCPLEQQAKLLRFLETGEYEKVGSSKTQKSKARIVAATNANLKELIEQGKFREDLYYRLATVPIEVPPLRMRREDILLMGEHFLKVFNKRYNKCCRFSCEGIDLLKKHSWPGNVRELNHSVERSVILAKDNLISPDGLGLVCAKSEAASLDDMSLEEVEAYLIRRTLKQEDGNVTATANKLGMSRATLYRRLKNLGI